MSRHKLWKEFIERRDRWLERTFVIGVLGLVTILVNAPNSNLFRFGFGIIIGIVVYAVFMALGAYKSIKYHVMATKVSKLKKD